MKADSRFVNLNGEFWANVRAVSESVHYTETLPGHYPVPRYLQGPKTRPKRNSQIKVPTPAEVRSALLKLNLQTEHLFSTSGKVTAEGKNLLDYFAFRAHILNKFAQDRLQDAPAARDLFLKKEKSRRSWECPLPRNNQGIAENSKKFLTCLVNMIICENAGPFHCNFDPQNLVRLTHLGRPVRTLARRVDGAFPSPVDPIALWEIKEYYYTTTFGSAVSRGVFETQLDGMELAGLKPGVLHYLFIDGHYCWWAAGGKPYLCRLIDLLHQGFVNEILVGSEVLTRLPELVKSWVSEARRRGLPIKRPAANP